MTADVCVVGELLWDVHADGELSNARHFRRVVGGAAANVAIALSGHGLLAAVVSAVGDDAFGRGLVAELANHDVDVSAIVSLRGQTGTVFIEPFRAGAQRFFSYRPTTVWPARPRLPEAWRRGSLRGRQFHIAAVNPGELTSLLALAERVVARGASVSIDLNARPRAWRGKARGQRQLLALMRTAAWIKASVDDLQVLGLTDGALPLRERLPSELATVAQQATLLVTRGRGAVSITSPWGTARVIPVATNAAWAIGAGDAFSAGLLAGHAHAQPSSLAGWRRLVKDACTAAAAHLERTAVAFQSASPRDGQ